MDGASKFVRGDAVAGLLITFINIIGGIIIGTVQRGLSVADAAQNYTLLTVGDGLVSQIPALIVSVGAGILVTKAGIKESTDKAVFGQLGGYPNALGISGILMLVMAMLPGIPAAPFIILGVLTGGMAYLLSRRATERVEAVATAEETKAAPATEEPISTALAIDLIRLELGYGLLSMNKFAEGAAADQPDQGAAPANGVRNGVRHAGRPHPGQFCS